MTPRPASRVTTINPELLAVRSVTFMKIRKLCASVASAAWLPFQGEPWRLTSPGVVLLPPTLVPSDPVAVLSSDEAYEVADILVRCGELLDNQEEGSFDVGSCHIETLEAPNETVAKMVGAYVRISDTNQTPGHTVSLKLPRADCDPVAYALKKMARKIR